MKEIKQAGEIKGFLASQFYAEPFPFYYLKFVEVSPDSENQGNGSSLLHDFTHSLNSTGSCGILYNAIEGPARDMYAKAGWIELHSHPGWFAYNLPPGIEQEALDEAIVRLEII